MRNTRQLDFEFNFQQNAYVNIKYTVYLLSKTIKGWIKRILTKALLKLIFKLSVEKKKKS